MEITTIMKNDIEKQLTRQAADIVKRAYEFNIKGRKQGLVELEADIDEKGLKHRDIFEYGIRLAAEGLDYDCINIILSNMINTGQDEPARKLKIIQKEAVLCIHKGLNSILLLCILFSFFNDDECRLVRGLLKNESFAELLEMY
jgi:flagellar motor component MotA